MTQLLSSTLLLVLLVAMAGCHRHHPDDDGKRITSHIAVHENGVIARARSGHPALIAPDGTVLIDGIEVPLEPAQRLQAKRYHDTAATLYAGVLELAAQDASPMAPDAATGDEIQTMALIASDPDTSRDSLVRRLCLGIAELEAAQDSLVETTPAFRPHATLSGGAGEHCQSALDL